MRRRTIPCSSWIGEPSTVSEPAALAFWALAALAVAALDVAWQGRRKGKGEE